MSEFDSKGILVYALSYDEADALRDFRDAHGITYTLLSDPGSEVIESFGILNTLIDPNDHPWYGIPYPGTYVIGADGTISHKFFDNNLAVRAGPEQLLRAATGETLTGQDEGSIPSDSVQVSVALDGDAFAPIVQKDLVARFRIPAGRHVYADPAPAGSVAVDVVLDQNDRVVQRAIVRPESDPHTLAGTGESFRVHHDAFELRLPLTVNGRRGGDASEITVSGEIRWQACDDEVCDIPEKCRFELTVPVVDSPPVALGSGEGATLEPNAMSHFLRMSERRKTGA